MQGCSYFTLEHEFAEGVCNPLLVIHMTSGLSQVLPYCASFMHEVFDVTFLPRS